MVTQAVDTRPATGARRPGSYLAIERSIRIDAPPERVWALIHDVGRSPEWAGSGEVRAMQRLDAGPIGVGTRYRSDQKVRGMGYQTISTVQVYEPNRLLIWHVAPPNDVRSAWGFRLEPEAGGTRLTHFYDLDHPRGFPKRVLYRLMFRVLNRPAELGGHIAATLQNVKTLVETQPAAASTGGTP